MKAAAMGQGGAETTIAEAAGWAAVERDFGMEREGGMRGGMGGGRGGMGPGGAMRGDGEQIESEIGKQIKEILTPQQKKVLRDVQKMIEQKAGKHPGNA